MLKVELNLSNHTTKADSIKANDTDIYEFAKNTDSARLKLDIGELDVGKLKTAPVDLSKLSNIVDNNVNKMTLIK